MNKDTDKRVLYYGMGFIGIFLVLIFLDKILSMEYTSEPPQKVQVGYSQTVTPTPTPVVTGDNRTSSRKIQDRVAAYLDYYIQLINKKDYKKAYTLLKPDFKKERFHDLATFQKYIEHNYKKQYNLVGRSFKEKDGLAIVGVELAAKQYTQDEIINGIKQQLETFTVEEKKPGNFDIAFGSFISANEINRTFNVTNGITIQVIKRVRYVDSLKYTLLVNNSTGKTLNLYKDDMNPNINLIDMFNNKIAADRNNLYMTNTKIYSKVPTLVELSFSNYYTSNFTPFRINFANANTDGVHFIPIDIYME